MSDKMSAAPVQYRSVASSSCLISVWSVTAGLQLLQSVQFRGCMQGQLSRGEYFARLVVFVRTVNAKLEPASLSTERN